MPEFPPPPPSEDDFPPLPPDDARETAPASPRKGKTRPPRALVILVVVGAVIYGGSVAYKSIAQQTIMSYGFSLDGKEIPGSETPAVRVDGVIFESGSHLKPGRHKMAISVPKDVEPYEQHFWVLYGERQLGNLPLETSKGSLSVTANPSPATVIVRSGREDLTNGQTPFRVEKLRVGMYTIVVKRGDYEETRTIEILRQQTAEMDFALNLGIVDLSADPADAHFELSGNRRHWQGNLPIHIEDVPGGDYSLVVRRKGWEIRSDISVSRGNTASNNTVFAYGSIDVVSVPAGLVVSTNGVEIGKAPLTLQELRSGDYVVTATDGANDLKKTIHVGPKKAAKETFTFQYGSVNLASTPPGATVIRKGKVLGMTPLTLDHIALGGTEVKLELTGYASTTVRLDVKEGSTVDEAAKLVSEQYLNFMADAHRAATNNPPLYPQAITSIGLALHESPGEPEAVQFRDECQYHLDFNEASRLFTSHDLDGALTNIEAAMLLKPTSAEGATLKSKILTAISERYKQAADEMEISKQKAIVDLTRKFDSFLDRIINNNKKQTIVDTNLVYPTVAFNVASTSAAVKEALSTAIKKLNPQWEVKSQESPSPDTTVFYLNQSVAGSNPPDQLIVLTSDLPDHAVHVRANLVTVVLAGGADKITRQASGTAALADFINRFRAELPKGAIIEP